MEFALRRGAPAAKLTRQRNAITEQRRFEALKTASASTAEATSPWPSNGHARRTITQGRAGPREGSAGQQQGVGPCCAGRLAHGPDHRDTRWCVELMKATGEQEGGGLCLLGAARTPPVILPLNTAARMPDRQCVRTCSRCSALLGTGSCAEVKNWAAYALALTLFLARDLVPGI